MERNYATQMDAARRGIVTPELKKVAEKEYMAVEDLMPLVASGKVAIPANKLHTCIDPEGIGSMLRTKINVNLGVSKDCKDYDVDVTVLSFGVRQVALLLIVSIFVAFAASFLPVKRIASKRPIDAIRGR